MEGAIQMDACFLMHRDPVGARIGKRRDELVGALDHQVAIERDAGDFPEGGDDGGSNSNVRDEVAIHDGDMEKGAPPSTAACTSAPRRAKSAERIEGASSIMGMFSSLREHAVVDCCRFSR